LYRYASVRASEDSWVLEVGRKGVESVVRERPLLVDDFAKFIADRQRESQALVGFSHFSLHVIIVRQNTFN
jgi:CRP-like cAMP-binding protein